MVEHGQAVRFYFDPACPWTWMTSRWLLEVAGQRPVRVQWRSLSLAVLNEGREVPEHRRASLEASRRLHRLFQALLAAGRNDDVGRVYAEYGRRVHVVGESPTPEHVAHAVDAAGVGDARDALDDAGLDAAVRSSHDEAQRLAGPDAGSPVLHLVGADHAAFGPILSPPPRGDDAARLWDALAQLWSTPQFYELKRARRGPPEIPPDLV